MFQIFKITKLAWDARDGTCFLVVLTPKSMYFPYTSHVLHLSFN